MSNSRKLIVEIVGDSKGLDRTFRGVETRSQTFARKLQGNAAFKGGLGGGLIGGVSRAGVIGASVAAGSAVAITALKKVTDAAKDAQVAKAGLDQAFASTGASEAFRRDAEKTIQTVSKLAGIDDEEVSRNFANLLRTTGSVAKSRRDIALAANIARARNISLAASTKIVEKAENGQLRGLKAIGVQIDKNTTSSEAIDRAQRKFAGSAEAYGRTAQGAQDKLSVSFENLEERLGTKLLPIITKLSLKLIDFIDWSERNWPRFAKAVGDAYRDAKPFIDNTIATIKAVVAVFEAVVKTIQAIANGQWSKAWAGIKQAAVAELNLIYHAFLELPLKLAKALGKAALAPIENAFKASFNRIIDLINGLLGKLKPVAGFLGHLGIDVKVPQVGHLGSGTSASQRRPGQQSAGLASRPDEGTRKLSVNLSIDGRQLNARMTPYRQQAQRRNPPQRRGPNAGLVSG